MLRARIAAIATHLPEQQLTNSDLALVYEGWSEAKILQKTGIDSRRIAAPDELSSDLSVAAAKKLFAQGVVSPSDIDFILFCTQSPDYFLPTTACLIQDRLGVPTESGALDFNLGCSGFVYGLGLAKGLVETGQARNVLLLTGETYSKFIHPDDRSVRTLFGDAAAATLVRAESSSTEHLGPFCYGTDGRGGENLIVPAGGLREPLTPDSGEAITDDNGNTRNRENLFMNGPEIFRFASETVPTALTTILAKAALDAGDVDQYVFHQANEYMLGHLRKKCGIPADRFPIHIRDCGNTVSATIPLAMERCLQDGTIKEGDTVVVVGFGVGYSWASAIVRW